MFFQSGDSWDSLGTLSSFPSEPEPPSPHLQPHWQLQRKGQGLKEQPPPRSGGPSGQDQRRGGPAELLLSTFHLLREKTEGCSLPAFSSHRRSVITSPGNKVSRVPLVAEKASLVTREPGTERVAEDLTDNYHGLPNVLQRRRSHAPFCKCCYATEKLTSAARPCRAFQRHHQRPAPGRAHRPLSEHVSAPQRPGQQTARHALPAPSSRPAPAAHLAFSFSYDLMWLYQRSAWHRSAGGGPETASNTATSACDGTNLRRESRRLQRPARPPGPPAVTGPSPARPPGDLGRRHCPRGGPAPGGASAGGRVPGPRPAPGPHPSM